ncbi:LysR family transcriptional regulator [Bradyrhizobium sp. Pear77]|uniref:LysR family transcriptional regulator n=1 Tax=Bradyrhizobium TaxID=374 RepID=UPI001E5B09B6|nr:MULTISPECIES: LysR family transcriptional regulator [Bradyrhizobium]MCC8954352.1 LysR family transcriptional regulator [Bradyrhizobium altum]MCC8964388.1 LysR family transcriptional regulator [Bradyrhizobium oropedii]
MAAPSAFIALQLANWGLSSVRHRKIPDLSDFDLKLLRVFAAVANAGGFSAAEVALNKSKSSISVDIASLEVRLGVKLCRRGRAGFSLTAEGEQILSLARELFDGLESFRENASRVAMKITGELVVVMDDNFPLGKRAELAGIVKTFHTEHPEVFLTIRTTSPERVAQMILDGTADMGISASAPDIAGTKTYPLFYEPMVLCCGREHPLYSKSDGEINDEALQRYDCIDIVTRQHSQSREIINQLNVRARAPTMQARLILILAGAYIGFLPRDFASSFVARDLLKIVRERDMCFTNVCSAIVRNEVSQSSSRELLLELVRRSLFEPGFASSVR